MNSIELLRKSLKSSDFCVRLFLSDLSDQDILVAPVPGSNHIAYQLGHLIESLEPGASIKLPSGFAEAHGKSRGYSEDTAGFLKKDEYLKLMEEVRSATFRFLDKLTESDLDKATHESMQAFAPTWGDLMALIGSHYLMHTGQFVVVRRKLAKKIVM